MYTVPERERVVEAYLRGEGTHAELSARYGVPTSTIGNWCRQWRERGSLEPRPGRGGRRVSAADQDALRALRLADPHATQRELAARLHERVGRPIPWQTVRAWLRSMNLPTQPVPRPSTPKPPRVPFVPLHPPAPFTYQDRHRALPEPSVPRRAYPTDLTDEQWAHLEPHLNALFRPSGRPGNRREMINAMLYQVRSGAPWRLLPHDFPHWNTVAKTFYRWNQKGIWQKINDALVPILRTKEGRKPNPTASILDSRSVKTTEKGGSAGTMAGRK